MLTFPIGYAIYYLVLDVQWLGSLHFMALFAVIGIGADDLFVLHALWTASAKLLPHHDLEVCIKGHTQCTTHTVHLPSVHC